jgi:hypothetical protein
VAAVDTFSNHVNKAVNSSGQSGMVADSVSMAELARCPRARHGMARLGAG